MLRKILTFELGLNESVTGFITPPSTIDSTMYYGGSFIRLNGTRIIPVLVPYCFTIKLVNYGYIQFCRWIADVVGKKENIDWDKFK